MKLGGELHGYDLSIAAVCVSERVCPCVARLRNNMAINLLFILPSQRTQNNTANV